MYKNFLTNSTLHQDQETVRNFLNLSAELKLISAQLHRFSGIVSCRPNHFAIILENNALKYAVISTC